MAERVASILAEIGIDSSKFQQGTKGVLGGLQQMISGFGAAGISATAAVGAFLTVAQALGECEKAAVESAKADAKLQAVLTSTGGAAGMTKDSLDALADKISRTASIDDELVKSAEAVMLTFTRVGGEVFPQAMMAATDMSAVLGTDLQAAVIQVGKAMNNFTGYTALKRAGVSFTDEQIEQIKNFKETNNLVDYQKLIMKELEKEFGNAAQSITMAGDGSENLNTSFGNLKEEIGTGLIPATRTWNNSLTDIIDGLTGAIAKANEYNDTMTKLGITWVNGVGYVQDGNRVTYEQVEAQVDAQRAIDASIDRWNALAAAHGVYVESLKQSEIEMQELSDANLNLIDTTMQYAAINEEYQTRKDKLDEEFTELTLEREKKKAQGYSDTSQAVKKIDAALAENAAAAEENAARHEAAGQRIMFSLVQQQMMMDGVLEPAETAALQRLGIEWGLFSQKTVEEGEKAVEEAKRIATESAAAADEVSEVSRGIAGIPKETYSYIYVHTYYTSSGGGGGGFRYQSDSQRQAESAGGNSQNNSPDDRGRAVGGPSGGLTLVGEAGPELVNLPTGSFVHNNHSSARMGGGQTININISGNTMLANDRSTAKQLAKLLKPELDGMIRISA